MNLEEIRQALTAALPLRPPQFAPGDSGQAKVRRLEDYMLKGAHHQAELEEALHWLEAAEATLRAQVEQITGFEQLLPRKSRDRITRQDTLAAKRMAAPAIFDAGAEAKQLRISIERQIKRFRFEYEVVSRAYTMATGG